MEDTETPRMHKYGESKTTRIMMATVRHVTSSSGLGKFQAAWILLNRWYIFIHVLHNTARRVTHRNTSRARSSWNILQVVRYLYGLWLYRTFDSCLHLHFTSIL